MGCSIKQGTFVWAKIPFAEGDGRFKVRPVLILGKMEIPTVDGGGVAYVAAGMYSSVDKVRGAVEVVFSTKESAAVGIGEKEGVLRLSKDSLVFFRGCDVRSEAGRICALPAAKQESIRRAAKAIRFEL